MKKLINLTGQSIIINGQEILSEGEVTVDITYSNIGTSNNVPVRIVSKAKIQNLPKYQDSVYLVVHENVKRYADSGRLDLVTLAEDENTKELFLKVDMPIVNYE